MINPIKENREDDENGGATDTIYISGAGGFVGAVLSRYFLDLGCHVTAILGPSKRSWRLPQNHPRLKLTSFDLSSAEEVKSFVRTNQPKIFFHCAAFGAYSNQTNIDDIYRINFNVVRYLLENLSQVEGFRAFVQAGSQSEYGVYCSGPAEDSPVLPDSDYAVSKVACTTLVQYYALKFSMPAWVFRLYSVYGPFEDGERLIPKLLSAAQKKTLPPLVSPDISRDFVFIEDVCDAYKKLLKQCATLKRGEVFNIGSGTMTTFATLVETAKKTFQISEEPQWGSMPNRAWDHPQWFSNPKKALRDLGWKANTSLAEGLRKTSDWMNKNPRVVSEAIENSVFRFKNMHL